MSVPRGFFELARLRGNEREFDAFVSRPEAPVFVRFVPVRASAEHAYCGRVGMPCGLDDWTERYPRETIYAGPVQAWQVPLVARITEAAVRAQWPLDPICQTWGRGAGTCEADYWLLPHEVVPIAPHELFPWPYHQARWTRLREEKPPLAHRLVAQAPPNPLGLVPARTEELARQ